MQAAERAAWLRLTLTPGLGLPDTVFSAGLPALLRVVPEPLAHELARAPGADIQAAVDATERWLAASTDHALLTLADPEYPQALLTTADPPAVLFAVGRLVDAASARQQELQRDFAERFRDFASRESRALYRDLFGGD